MAKKEQKLKTERLRTQEEMKKLQKQNQSLQEEVKFFESQQF